MNHHHIRPLIEEVGMQVEEHEQGRAGEDEQEDEQEDNAEVEQEAVADGAQRVVEEAHEVPAVRGVRDPGQPTREERARHDLTHLPFRPWCADCVAGRAVDDPHRRLVPKRPKRLLSEPILAHVKSLTVQLFGLLRGARTMHEHCRRAVHVKSHEINGWSVSLK